MKNIFIILTIFLSIAISQVFDTEMGKCTLEIYGGEIANLQEIQDLIIEKANQFEQEFGAIEKRPFYVFITENMDEYRKQVKGYVPEWGIAVAKRNPDRMVIKSPKMARISYARLLDVIVHELHHILMFRIMNNIAVPSWYKEGLAMKYSGEFSLVQRINISKHLWNNNLIPLLSLKYISSLPNYQIQLAYAQSAAAVLSMDYFYGADVHQHILREINSGRQFWDAMERVTGDNRLDFQEHYEIFIENNYSWMILLKAGNLLFLLAPIILGVGYYYRYRKNKNTMNRWAAEELELNTENGLDED